MGIEYRLTLNVAGVVDVSAVLRRLPTAHESAAQPGRFEFGDGAWPDAVVQVEQGSVYYCDNSGGRGRELLGVVVAHLVAAFGPVTVAEL